MREFIDDNFLLRSETAQSLYHQYAKAQPIIDYHCHLNPQEIYENKRFSNLTEVWLYGDHYKWRALRANGYEEKWVTGGKDVGDYDRFLAWVKTVPMLIGNPLYHWSHLELKRIFGIGLPINEKNAPEIWAAANRKLQGEGFAVRDLIRKANVEVICTTDDPADDLAYHLLLRQERHLGFQVLPSYRPDKALEINRPTFLPWIRRLEEAIGRTIADYPQLLEALEERAEFFHTAGCRVSDHALDSVLYQETDLDEASAIFARALAEGAVSKDEEARYKTFTLQHLGRMYAKRGWTMQLHLHAHRNNNTRMFKLLGPDTGYDSINDGQLAGPLVRFLDSLDQEGALPKTILYSLNSGDNDVLASIIGSFQGDGVPGKIQLGSAWWFNDTKDGMLAQLRSLAGIGLLGRFVGMLTDSRSFLSYTRHEYFRRILCNLLGDLVEQGEVAGDLDLLGELIGRICYGNAKQYFKFN